MVKAIFLDIDGTLVSFNTHKVPQSAIDAVNKVREKGIRVFIATGRPAMLINNLGDLKFDGYITMNGGYCMATENEVIYQNCIPDADIRSIIDYLNKTDRFPCSFFTKDDIYINYVNDRVRELSELVNVPVPKVKDLHLVEGDILQINIYTDREQEEDVMRAAFRHCDSSRWNPLFADVNPKGNNKRTGIDKILEYYHLSLSETMSFGDGGNDIPMLSHTAIGIAMGNAEEAVKETAGYVTDTVDDHGIWNALKHFDII